MLSLLEKYLLREHSEIAIPGDIESRNNLIGEHVGGWVRVFDSSYNEYLYGKIEALSKPGEYAIKPFFGASSILFSRHLLGLCVRE